MAGRVRKRTNVKSKYGSGRSGGQRRGAAQKKQAEARKVRDQRLNPGGDLYKETLASGNRPEYKSSKMKGKAYSTSSDAAKIRQWNNDREAYLLKESQKQLELDKKEAARVQRAEQAERQRQAAVERQQAQQEYRDRIVGMQVGAAESEIKNRNAGPDTGVRNDVAGSDTARENNMRNVKRKRGKASRSKANEELDAVIDGKAIDPRSRRKSVFDKNRRQLLGQARRDSKAKLGYGR